MPRNTGSPAFAGDDGWRALALNELPQLSINSFRYNCAISWHDAPEFTLQFCPTVSSEKELRTRFAKLGIAPGKTFDAARLAPELREAVTDGIADAWKEFAEFLKTSVDTGKVTSGDVFGTRAFLKNNYLYRMAGAVLGIYGNSKQEAMYPDYFVDAAGRKLDGAGNRYTLRFVPEQLPPSQCVLVADDV